MLLLCVDDDADDVELFQDAVKFINDRYTCLVANNGSEALKVLDTITPDYIFLDINMPVMDGKETLKSIRTIKRFHSVPICILSTSDSKAEIQICRDLGANNWLVKPNTFQKLISALEMVIGGKAIL